MLSIPTKSNLQDSLPPESFPIENKFKSSQIDGYTVYYINEANFQELYHEIFIEKVYEFKTHKNNPVIFDCGGNIGMAVIFFKILYPDSKITCFEPDPNTYAVLCKNVETNKLKDVILVNAAVSDYEGEIDFFGEFYGEQPNSLGNSIIKEWGDRGYTDRIKVKSVILSKYITSQIDFLKLDVEGVELNVLKELGDKLSLVKQISLETHQVKTETTLNKLTQIKALLMNYDFKVSHICKSIKELLPTIQQPWVEKNDPEICVMNAENTILL